MLIKNIDLNMSHVGLGRLNEYSVLVLFGNMHSYHLVHGLDIMPHQIYDNDGFRLYPAYFMTHLTIPLKYLLFTHGAWETITIGVDVKRFGNTMLDSTYILGRKDEITVNVNEWEQAHNPMMRANSLFVLDASELKLEKRRVSAPKTDCLADLPKITKIPDAYKKSIKVREIGFESEDSPTNLFNREPIEYTIKCNSDAAPGHTMIFAKFSEIMDYAEYELLSRRIIPGFPDFVVQHISLIEREIYYYSNCYIGDKLDIYIKGSISICKNELVEELKNHIIAAQLCYQIDIYNKSNKLLIATAKTHKAITLPIDSQNLVYDIKRIIMNIKNYNLE